LNGERAGNKESPVQSSIRRDRSGKLRGKSQFFT
jgi:hypothetical protein